MRARGSAIIISMLMITAIGSIAFAIGRLLFIESTSASFYANGSVAYYAAESGLEEGFLRYRYNMSSEVPFSAWRMDTPNQNQVFRTNLASDSVNKGAALNGISKTTTISDANILNQYYDLRMGYIGTDGFPWFGPKDSDSTTGLGLGDFATVDTSAPYYVKQDDAIKIDLTGFDLSNTLKLDLKFFGNTINPILSSSTQKCKALIEAKMIVTDATGTNEYKSLLNYNRTTCGSILSPLGITKLYIGSVTSSGTAVSNTFTYTVDKLQEIISTDNRSPVPLFINDAKVSLFLKPLFYDAAIGVSTTTCTTVGGTCVNKQSIVAGPTTKIESTGYYGGTTRKLEADIDRQSGTLYDLFDYVIYKAS